MSKIKGKCWAILVEFNDGTMFAEDLEIPATQSFRKVLCDTKKHAQMLASMDKVVPKGKSRVVPVTMRCERSERGSAAQLSK